ncbi:MAG: hypothetical protein FWC89_02275 [Defluviitaleaceae bacterium]|nr:hypothetical protein [Defluviitaleaceae bacterium]
MVGQDNTKIWFNPEGYMVMDGTFTNFSVWDGNAQFTTNGETIEIPHLAFSENGQVFVPFKHFEGILNPADFN